MNTFSISRKIAVHIQFLLKLHLDKETFLKCLHRKELNVLTGHGRNNRFEGNKKLAGTFNFVRSIWNIQHNKYHHLTNTSHTTSSTPYLTDRQWASTVNKCRHFRSDFPYQEHACIDGLPSLLPEANVLLLHLPHRLYRSSQAGMSRHSSLKKKKRCKII